MNTELATLIHSNHTTPLKTASQDWQVVLDEIKLNLLAGLLKLLLRFLEIIAFLQFFLPDINATYDLMIIVASAGGI